MSGAVQHPWAKMLIPDEVLPGHCPMGIKLDSRSPCLKCGAERSEGCRVHPHALEAALAATKADLAAAREELEAERGRYDELLGAAERRVGEARAEAFEEAARLLEPTGPRPCDCDHCTCGNPGDHTYVAAWDEASANAKAIRAAGAAR